MVEKVKDSKYESQQHLISESNWDTQGLHKSIAKNASDLFCDKGALGLTIDEKGHIKKGERSVAVARQYAGVAGKVENCQVGVYMSLTAERFSTIINQRLFLPKAWTEDKIRCKAAGIPDEHMVFKTKPQLALEMIKEHINDGVHFDYINGDGLYGNNYELMKGISALGKEYVLDIHNYQRIFPEGPIISVPPKEAGTKGRTPTLLRANVSGMKVRDYAKTSKSSDFKEVKIRRTTKGWLKAKIHVKEVRVWDEKNEDNKAFKQTLVYKKPLKKDDKEKFALSNIPIESQSVEMFAYMQAQRFWIEKCFKDDNHDLGMSDYQVRGWKGWHNHMVLTFLSMLFITEQRIKYQENMPLLLYNDARELLSELIVNRARNFDEKVEQMKKRHIQRANDIRRYYKEENEIVV